MPAPSRNNNNSGLSQDPASQLTQMEEARARLRKLRKEKDQQLQELEAAIEVERKREEEEQRLAVERKQEEEERRRRAEQAERQRVMEERRKRELEERRRKQEEDKNKDSEMKPGPSASKKRKINETGEVEQTTKRKNPACSQCTVANVVCYGKTRGPGCWRCYKRKVGCSAAGGNRKRRVEVVVLGTEKESEKGMGGLERMAKAVEKLTEVMEELVEEQRGIRIAMEVWMRREEEK